ncbi:MAG: 8-amino-7-oxononanoate synthase [Chitinophagaceae bacterium]|nr:8-amino-7-oxononanoate synthase [Oligoflexus sp.]
MSGFDIFRNLAEDRLSSITAQGRLRTLRTLPHPEFHPSEPPSVIDLTHNDYLGFRYDAAFQSRALEAARQWPMGAGASRLLGGEHRIYEDLETAFSLWKGAEASLYFASGYAANETLMSVLALCDAEFFSDSLNHASLIDGMRLARIRPEFKHIFRHNDLEDLERKLERSTQTAKVVITESLFSMDGDEAPLKALEALCQRYQTLLVVDEAHALGVYGPDGSGLISAHKLNPDTVISINPCGKAMAAGGALISGPSWLRRLLINTGRGFIYSTGASPWVAAGLLANLQTIKEAQARRAHLHALSKRVRRALQELGYDTGMSSTHIIPIIVGSEDRSLQLERALADRDIRARAIRPPTVPERLCRLRLSLHAALSDVEPLLSALKDIS